MLLPFLTLGVECEWGHSSARAAAAAASGDQSSVVSDVESSLLSTAVFAGMLVGALLSGLLSDRWGRRPTVLLLTACTGLFGLGSALASSFHSLLLCRAMVGVGVGGSPAALALFTEFLPKQQRGRYLVHYSQSGRGSAFRLLLLERVMTGALNWAHAVTHSSVCAAASLC